MRRRAFGAAALFLTAAILAACSSGSTGPFIPPPVSVSGLVNGSLVLTAGVPQTIQVSQPGYSGTYFFSIGNPSVATLSLPAGAAARRRNSSSNVSDTQGSVTVNPVAPGSTTLTVLTNTTTTVPVVVSGGSPSPTPPPSALVASPTSLTFLSAGAGAAQTVTVSEVAFGGTLSETDTCSGIATVSPTQSSSPYTATITPVGGGSCTITFTDGSQTAPVSVSVTTSGVIINGRGHVKI